MCIWEGRGISATVAGGCGPKEEVTRTASPLVSEGALQRLKKHTCFFVEFW